MYPSITHQTPGIHSRFETQEPQIFWGNSEFWGKDVMFGLLDGSSRDLGQAAGSQHILRAGLVLGYHVANERWVPYDSTAAAAEGGTLRGVLAQTVAVVIDGVDTDKTIAISHRANVKADALLFNQGTPANLTSHALEATFRTALNAAGFRVDDWFQQ